MAPAATFGPLLTNRHTHLCSSHTTGAPLWTLCWCYQAPQRGNMFSCLWLQNIFCRLITSQALQSSMGVVLYVCAHGAGVD